MFRPGVNASVGKDLSINVKFFALVTSSSENGSFMWPNRIWPASGILLKLSPDPVENPGRYVEFAFTNLNIAPFKIRKGRFQFAIRLDITPIHKQLPADFDPNISFR